MSFLNPYGHNAGGGNDPFFSSVVLLLHFDNNFTDSSLSGHTITQFPNPNELTSSATQSKFGGFSCYSASNSHGANCGVHADFGLGTADYTIELWLRLSTVSITQQIIDFRTSADQPRPVLYINSDNTLRYFSSNADRITSGASIMTLNTWAHIALSRASGTSRLFVDGTQTGSNFADSENCTTTDIVLMHPFNASNVGIVDGYMDDLRITKGIARYTANFTPPVAAFPNL